MFGYIYVNEQELKLREYTTYRSFYCGLCQELHRRYGRRAQMVLNYDMTFLAILLTGLYEPETLFEDKRCLPHPVHKHPMAKNDAIGYAADMCVLLAYQKGLDDWEDEHKVTGRTISALLKSGYDRIREEYPRQAKSVEENICLLHEVEETWKKTRHGNPDGKDGNVAADEGSHAYAASPVNIDYVAGLTGNFLAELYVWKEDIWQEDLRQIGFYLGKFIYLLDAVEDIEKDRKHGNYNVFLAKNNAFDEKKLTPDEDRRDTGTGLTDIWEEPRREEIRKILNGMMAEASRAFERLPVIEYAPIIRNILYSGVWCKYSVLQEKVDRKKEQRTGTGGDYERSI
ncbi:MAG: DUF5685 family protein [Lachnospiraceae bacterium]|nr:DUF5685 family protein [Lachnospiraceae bacterium]